MSKRDSFGVISALVTAKIAATAAVEGLDRVQLLALCGVAGDEAIDPAQMVSSADHYALWEAILKALHSPGFPIRYAESLCADDYGAFGLATKTAPTLREAFHRAHRYLRVLTNSSWLELSESDALARIAFRREGARRLGMRCANEAAIAEMVAHAREICGVDLAPHRIQFRHAAPGDISEHERFFACEVCFEQELDCIEFESATFDLALAKADDGLSRFVLDHLDKAVADAEMEPSIERSLRELVCDALPSGPPKMDDVAKRIGMSRRTLARRLQVYDTTFQRFVEETRREVAAQLLKQTQHSLGEISFLLGFSEQSAFQRAFKRWTGHTPTEFRNGL